MLDQVSKSNHLRFVLGTSYYKDLHCSFRTQQKLDLLQQSVFLHSHSTPWRLEAAKSMKAMELNQYNQIWISDQIVRKQTVTQSLSAMKRESEGFLLCVMQMEMAILTGNHTVSIIQIIKLFIVVYRLL